MVGSGGGRDTIALSTHKKCFLVSPDQLQTFFFFNRQHFKKQKITLITEHNYAATVMVSMTYQISNKLCNYLRNHYIKEKHITNMS